MSFNEREITMPKLFFKEGLDQVAIGANIIPKAAYYANQKEFDSIITTGDSAWNQVLNQTAVTIFIVELSCSKAQLLDNKTLQPKRLEYKGCESMNMKELAKQEEIKNNIDNIPVGMTKLKADSIDIVQTEVEFNGIKKTRYELTATTVAGDKVKFGCGVQVYNGLIAASKLPNVKTIYITRNGTTKDDTKYTVVGE